MTSVPYVDNTHNINIHVSEDLYIPILGASGADISLRSLWFEILGTTISVALLAHPSDALSRLLYIPVATLASVPPGASFVLLDKTGPVRAKWTGKLVRYK